jgi:hypothetical protein
MRLPTFDLAGPDETGRFELSIKNILLQANKNISLRSLLSISADYLSCSLRVIIFILEFASDLRVHDGHHAESRI